MPAAIEVFGDCEGQPVERITVSRPNGLTARFLSWGAVLQQLALPDGTEIALCCTQFDDYPTKSPYFGATVGRYANRIAGARFTLDGEAHRLDANQAGRHCLHGGSRGWGRRIWSHDGGARGDSVRFSLVSADGEMGFPGEVRAHCSYRLTDDSLEIEMTATTTRPTVVNMAHHSYWNLAGAGTVEDHILELAADGWLPVDDDAIPTGEIRDVAGTAFDFREPRRIDAAGDPRYDHCFTVPGTGLRRVAVLRDPASARSLTLEADQPGVQLYTGFKVNLETVEGWRIGPFAGLCLETQHYPDAPNRPQFPSPVLRPGEVYRHRMVHSFTW